MTATSPERRWPTTTEFLSAFREFVLQHHHDQITEILLQSDHTCPYGVTINVLDLADRLNEMSSLLLQDAERLLPIFDEAIKQAATEVYRSHSSVGSEEQRMVWKPHIRARLSNLPICPELTRTTLPRNEDVGKFLSITGTIIRATTVKMLEYERIYTCKKCGKSVTVQADPEQFNVIPIPPRCGASPATMRGDDGPCDSTKFEVSDARGSDSGVGSGAHIACRDYQEIKVQEQVSRLAVGTIPRSIFVILEDDLVDQCQAGDDVTICGLVIRRWMPLRQDIRCDLETVIIANHVRVLNARNQGLAITPELKEEFLDFWRRNAHAPLSARNRILASVCPQVFGLYIVKLSVLTVLIGGVPRWTEGILTFVFATPLWKIHAETHFVSQNRHY